MYCDRLNIKSKEGYNLNLKDIKFAYLDELSEEVMEAIHEDEDRFVSIFAKYEQAREIISNLLDFINVKLDCIILHSEEFDGYADEYVIDVWSEYGTTYIGCEPVKRNGEYLNCEGDIGYLLEDCSAKILKSCNYDEMYSVLIQEYDEEEYFDEYDDCEDCCECTCSCHKDKIRGFTAKKNTDNGYRTVSYYNTNGLDDSGVLAVLKLLGF